MKKLYKYIVLVIGIVTFFSCADEELVGSFGETGSDVILKLSFQSQANNDIVVSRAGEGEEDNVENFVYDLHFYVFDDYGDLTGYEQLVSENGDIPLGIKEVPIRTKTGKSYIYAVANINHSTLYYLENKKGEGKINVDDDKTDKELLDVFGGATLVLDENGNIVPKEDVTDDQLKAKVLEHSNDPNNKGLTKDKLLRVSFLRYFGDANSLYNPTPEDVFIMSGYVNEGESVIITKTGQDDKGNNIATVQGEDNVIKLYRILAKNTLRITSTGDGTFTPKYYRLCNVPKKGILIPQNFIGTTKVNTIDQYVGNMYFSQSGNSNVQVNITNLTSEDVESSFRANFGQPDSPENLDSSDTTEDSGTSEAPETSETPNSYTITFCYPENLQVPNATVDEKTGNNEFKYNKWKHRETNSYDKGAKNFTNAPANASYIEIYGEYVHNGLNEDGEYENIKANVTYTIHLGNFSAPNNRNSLFDYNVIRNYSYTYNVYVNDVDDIYVEATTSNQTPPQDNPYVEGLIINTQSGQHLRVDAHYEARVISFNLQDIIDLKDHKDAKGQSMGYFVNIKTPFGQTEETVNVRSNGVYKLNGDPICSIAKAANVFGNQTDPNNKNEADYEWIKFVKNGDTKVVSSISETTDNSIANGLALNRYPCVYPGDSYKKYDYNEDGSIKTTRQGGWLNVFELLAELYDESKYPTTGEVHYTCFIDENYYADKAWPEYVNKDDRTMLLANDLQISRDGKSIYANVKYSISQRSIATFYKTNYYPDGDNPTRLVIAFGTETVNEEDVYHTRYDNSDYSISNTQDWNARTSAISNNEGEDNWYTAPHAAWDDIDELEGDLLQPQLLYEKVAKACMSRNRDLDGDGDIDANEIRWYLPSIGQYRGLFIGQSAFIGKEAYLINQEQAVKDINQAKINNQFTDENGNLYETDREGNPTEELADPKGHWYRRIYHYFTCSGNNQQIFWPEEGLTNNPNGSGYSWAELVRCVRTLESDALGLSNPEKYYTYSSNNKTFNLAGIMDTRNPTKVAQEDHNEIQTQNNLFGSFEVATDDLSLPSNFQGYYNSYNRGTNSFNMIDVTGLDPDKLLSGDESQIAQIPNGQRNDLCNSLNTNGVTGWRTPNQKELALMVEAKAINNGYSTRNYGSRSRFSGCDKGDDFGQWHHTAGIWASGNGRMNVGDDYGNVRIRCVRDKQ